MLRDNFESDDPWILGGGASGVVTQYDETSVIKGYISYREGRLAAFREGYETDEELKKRNAREREIYERLSTNPDLKILKYYGAVELEPGHFGIRLEWAKNRDLRTFIRKNRDLRTFIRKNRGEDHPFEQRLGWVIDIANTLQGMHSMGVIHSDFSCRNIMVTEDLSLKIGDFDGSQLDDKPPMSCAEPWYEILPRGRKFNDIPLMKKELFALGCGIYEVMAWKKPCGDLDHNAVTKAYEREELPAIDDVPCADVIRKCWDEEFETAGEIAAALRAYRKE